MADKNTSTTQTPEAATPQVSSRSPQMPANLPPSEGGSYVVDDTTGQHTLVERTEPNTQPRSRT